MQPRPRPAAAMAEEGSPCALRRLPWASVLRATAGLAVVCAMICIFLRLPGHQQRLEPPSWDIAELQLNLTGPRQDPRLYWQGGPALGRSFLYGAQLDNGQLRVRRDGIYKLHIQVTLSNCSSFMKSTLPRRATLTVGICYPTSHSVSLLRLNFHTSCTVASQRLTPLAHGDTLCTNLTLPLLPSQNADETFFGIQWVHS